MKRLAALVVAFTCLAALTVAGTVGASPRSRPLGFGHNQIRNGKIKVGNTWTFYEYDGVATGTCEVLTFESGGVFTSDKDGTGSWSGNIKLVFPRSSVHFFGADYKGKYYSQHLPGTSLPGYDGAASVLGFPVQLYILLSGNDPLGVGGC